MLMSQRLSDIPEPTFFSIVLFCSAVFLMVLCDKMPSTAIYVNTLVLVLKFLWVSRGDVAFLISKEKRGYRSQGMMVIEV